MATETIQLDMNWRAAAGIIGIALEAGTGAGTKAARAELYKMADVADKWNANARNVQTLVHAGRALLQEGGPVQLETLRAALANFAAWE